MHGGGPGPTGLPDRAVSDNDVRTGGHASDNMATRLSASDSRPRQLWVLRVFSCGRKRTRNRKSIRRCGSVVPSSIHENIPHAAKRRSPRILFAPRVRPSSRRLPSSRGRNDMVIIRGGLVITYRSYTEECGIYREQRRCTYTTSHLGVYYPSPAHPTAGRADTTINNNVSCRPPRLLRTAYVTACLFFNFFFLRFYYYYLYFTHRYSLHL